MHYNQETLEFAGESIRETLEALSDSITQCYNYIREHMNMMGVIEIIDNNLL